MSAIGHPFFDGYFEELSRRLYDASADQLNQLGDMFVHVRETGRKVMLAGNGASAAISSHVAVDLTKAARIRALTFNESDLITCFANDYGYEQWIAKAVECYGDPGDLVVLISSSGASPNVVTAARRARERGLTVVTLSGFDSANPLRALGDLNLWVNSRSYNIVETTHPHTTICAGPVPSSGFHAANIQPAPASRAHNASGPNKWFRSTHISSRNRVQSGIARQLVVRPFSVRNQPTWLQSTPRHPGECGSGSSSECRWCSLWCAAHHKGPR